MVLNEADFMLLQISEQVPNLHQAGIVDIDASILVMATLFLVFFFLYHRIFVRGLVDMFEKRHDLTVGSREAAEAAVKTAEAKIAEYDTRIGEVRRRGVDETKRVRAEAEFAERAQLDAVKAEVGKEIEGGLKDLRTTAATARAELDSVARDAGNRIADRILGGAA